MRKTFSGLAPVVTPSGDFATLVPAIRRARGRLFLKNFFLNCCGDGDFAVNLPT
jgi:hypothetical protein